LWHSGEIRPFYGTFCYLTFQTGALFVPLYYLKQLIAITPNSPDVTERALQSKFLPGSPTPNRVGNTPSTAQSRLRFDSYEEDVDDFDPEPVDTYASGNSPTYARYQLHRSSISDSGVKWIS
jgi:hypothetical protein